MRFLLYQIKDIVLHAVFAIVVIGTLVFTLGAARDALHSLSIRSRRRLPFGLAGLFLTVCGVTYAYWAVRHMARVYDSEPSQELWDSMSAHLLRFYALFSGFALIAVPAFTLLGIWWDFRRPSAERIMARDHRSPVLLLRSFAGDETESGPSREVEMQLAKKLQREVGPLIALGSPNDFSPPDGARRDYVDDNAWQSKVTDYVERAAAVIFIVKRCTPAVRWETELVRERFKPERTVLIVLPRTNAADIRALTFRSDHLLEVLGAAGLTESSADWASATRGVVLGYEADWNPIVLKHDDRVPGDLADVTLHRLLSGKAAVKAS